MAIHCMKLPGLADVHVHLREPGDVHKETIRSGTEAALAGGFTTLLAMPNTHPPLVTLAEFREAQHRASETALCDVFHFAGGSADHLAELPALGQEAVGLKIYMDQTYGPLRVDTLAALMACFKRWPAEKPIAVHAEGKNVAVAIGLAAAFNRHVHICHVSRKDEITLIAHAKQRGIQVTCEVTPHHLFLSELDARQLGPRANVRPALASQTDVEALWAHLDTVVDCIATDHAPHTLAEKLGPDAPPGMPGLETALPLMLTAVSEGRLTLERLVALMAVNPRRIYGLSSQPDTWVEVDPDDRYTISDEGLHTKSGWSPFSGRTVRGRVRRVVLRGREVFADGVLHPPYAFHSG